MKEERVVPDKHASFKLAC